MNSLVAERLASVARDMRQAAGRLTGEAAGEEMAAEEFQVDLLGDCRDVLDGHPAKATIHLASLVTALAELRQGLYGHLDPIALGRMLREAGVKVGTVWAGGTDGKGVRREWLDVAATTDEDPIFDEDEEDLTEARGT